MMITQKMTLALLFSSNNYKLKVVAGIHSRHKKGKHVQYRFVKRVILHEKFNESTYDNDVALLHLRHPLHFTNHVQPVCIIENEMQENQLNFSSCYITGWGSSIAKGLCLSDQNKKLFRTICKQEL